MIKHGIDQQALIQKFSQAGAQQGEALRKAVNEATLKALQARGLSLAHIKQVLNTVAQAASKRDGRALGLQATQAMLDSYSTLVSGVLIGMSDALQPGAGAPPARRAKQA